MIAAFLTDPYHRTALRRAARADEDVILSRMLSIQAVEEGFPRLVVHSEGSAPDPYLLGVDASVPVLDLTTKLLRHWEERRRSQDVPVARLDHLARCMRNEIAELARDVTWVDRALADLARFAGHDLPAPLRTFGRKILEFPSHYTDLHPLAGSLEMTRGALKARFRRRGLESPYTYLRWFRVMACAQTLSDRNLTVRQVATRMGFTSDGNLCRAITSLTQLTPTELRSVKGWNRLLMAFAYHHLAQESLEAWRDLDDLFPGRVA